MGEGDDTRLLLTELRGQIDLLSTRLETTQMTLSQKVDQTHKMLIEKISDSSLLIETKLNSSHRETQQLITFHSKAVIAHERRLDEMEKRLTNIAEVTQHNQRAHDQEDDDRFTELFLFRTQIKTAFAVMAFLWPLLTAMILHLITK